jgi:septal ring factor EnvC (AmiA/AmiB activator)
MSKSRPPRGQPARAVKRATASAAAPASATAKRAAPNPLQAAVERLETRVLDLKRERDALAAELAEANARIAALDAARDDAVNRIDWVVDSLQTVLDDKS